VSSSRSSANRIPTTSPPTPTAGSKRPTASRTQAIHSKNGKVARRNESIGASSTFQPCASSAKGTR